LFYYLSCILNKILVLITPLHNYIDGLPVQYLMEYLHIETEHSFASVGTTSLDWGNVCCVQ
jgi:hypothetical protein